MNPDLADRALRALITRLVKMRGDEWAIELADLLVNNLNERELRLLTARIALQRRKR